MKEATTAEQNTLLMRKLVDTLKFLREHVRRLDIADNHKCEANWPLTDIVDDALRDAGAYEPILKARTDNAARVLHEIYNLTMTGGDDLEKLALIQALAHPFFQAADEADKCIRDFLEHPPVTTTRAADYSEAPNGTAGVTPTYPTDELPCECRTKAMALCPKHGDDPSLTKVRAEWVERKMNGPLGQYLQKLDAKESRTAEQTDSECPSRSPDAGDNRASSRLPQMAGVERRVSGSDSTWQGMAFVPAKTVIELEARLSRPVSTKDAVEALTKALRADEGYWISWKANIAMAWVDEWKSHEGKGGKHAKLSWEKIANLAAERFLNLLCRDVPKVAQHDNEKDGKNG